MKAEGNSTSERVPADHTSLRDYGSRGLSTMPEFKIERENVSFWLRVKPRSARERLTKDSTGELRLELHASPTEGEANKACVWFFARELRLPQACVVLLSGAKARRKLIRITGRSAEETVAQLERLVGEGRTRRPA